MDHRQATVTDVLDRRLLQLRREMPALFRDVFADPNEPRTIVIVPGLSMDGEVLAKVKRLDFVQRRQLDDAVYDACR